MTVVQFRSLDDFIAELRMEHTRVADKIVRFEVTTTPDESGLSHEIDVWATALLKSPPGDGYDEDYLIEYGQAVGVDDAESETDKEAGTKAADYAQQKLAEAVDDLRLKLRKGKIEVY